MKIAQYPIPQLWPKTVVKRYMHFQDVLHRQRDTLFEVYEADGGEYHGEPPESSNDEADEEKQSGIELDCDLDFWLFMSSVDSYDFFLDNDFFLK